VVPPIAQQHDCGFALILLLISATKYADIVFMDKRRKTTVHLPHPMPNVARVSVIKILGITFTNHLSVVEHVQTVNSSAQTLYALRTLRAHGMYDAALQTVFRSVVYGHSQADLRLKRVVGFCNQHRPATTSGIHSTKSS